MDDSQSREEARFNLASNAVVEAAAGTGKTSLLVDRILSLVLAGNDQIGIPIEKIVALTFTKKAASEMKTRLSEKLHEISSILGETDDATLTPFLRSLINRFSLSKTILKERAITALENVERAPIETLHAFAARILKLYPLEAGLSPSFEVDEGGFFNRFFESEWEMWLDVELGDNAPQTKEWIEVLRFLKINDLKELAKELCHEKIPLDEISSPRLKTSQELEELASQIDQILRRNPPPRSNSSIPTRLPALSESLRALSRAHRETKTSSLPNSLDLSGPSLSWPQWPKAWENDEEGNAVYLRAQKIVDHSSPEKENLLRKAVTLTIPFARQFRILYRKRGFISFDGLLNEVQKILQNRPSIREEIKRSFATFLIDEFQDTDPLQGEILFFLAETPGKSATHWADVRLGPGRLFVVGDPKQSIYRFRGADIAAYQKFTKKILESEKSSGFALSLNFRSSPTVVSPINAIFSKIMLRKEGLQAAHQKLQAAKKMGNSPAIEVVTLASSGNKTLDSSAKQKNQAQWMAQWIVDHCGKNHALKYKDIAILCRTGGGISHLTEAFKESQIPYSAQIENSLYESQELVDFLNLLRVLDNPTDKISMAGLLRSSLAGLSDSELYRLSLKDSFNYLLPQLGPKPYQLWTQILRNLESSVGRIPIGDLIEEVLHQTTLIETAAATYHGPQSVSNILKLSSLAKSAALKEGLTLREFIEKIAFEVRAEEYAGESPLADDYLDCVRILTIHKAKGLEFPVVMIPRASSKSMRPHTPTTLADWDSSSIGFYLQSAKASSATMSLLKIKEEERLRHETTRLLYVALTRAKDNIFLIGETKFENGSFAELLSSAGFWPASSLKTSADLEKAHPMPIEFEGVRTREIFMDESAFTRPQFNAEHKNSDLLDPQSWEKSWKNRLAVLDHNASVWSATPTQHNAKILENADEDIEESFSIPSFDQESALTGQLCHLALKKWDFKNPMGVEKLLTQESGVLSLTHPSPHWNKILHESATLLKRFLSSQTAVEISQKEILGREIPFAYEENGTVVRGVMDIVYRDHGKIVIADYKTGPPPPGNSPSPMQRYQEQAAIYCHAIEKFFGVKNVEFRIIFLRAPEKLIRWYNEKAFWELNPGLGI